MTDAATEKYKRTMAALSLENINKNLVEKGYKCDEVFYRDYNLPENKSHYEFTVNFQTLLENMDDEGEQRLYWLVEELRKLNPELAKVRFSKNYNQAVEFVLDVIYKMRPEDIDWYLNERYAKPENGKKEGMWACWVQQKLGHNYAYMICPENRKKLEDIVNQQQA